MSDDPAFLDYDDRKERMEIEFDGGCRECNGSGIVVKETVAYDVNTQNLRPFIFPTACLACKGTGLDLSVSIERQMSFLLRRAICDLPPP